MNNHTNNNASTTPVVTAAHAVDATAGDPTPVGIKLPPTDANIPAPPQGFVPTAGHSYRGLLPKKEELAVMPEVIAELAQATNFAQIFGQTVPPLDIVQQTFAAADQWSSMRAKTSEWDLFCRTQEGLAWRDQRALMARMKPAFELAMKGDSALAGRFRSLARFLAVNVIAAKRGVSTRKAKQKAEAHGQPPRTRGGKKTGTVAAPPPVETPATHATTPPVVNGAAAPATNGAALNGATASK